MGEIHVTFNHAETVYRYIDGESVSDEEMERRLSALKLESDFVVIGRDDLNMTLDAMRGVDGEN